MNLRTHFFLVSLFALVVSFASIAVPTVHASSYLVTPLALQLDVTKRDILQEHVTLVNKESHVVVLYATVNEVATNGNGIVQGFLPPSEVNRANTPTSWIEVSRQQILLQPNEMREIPFTIHMNPTVDAGKYNVFLGFGEGSTRPEAQNAVSSGNAPGMLIGLTVDQVQDQFLRLDRFYINTFVTPEKGGTVSYTLTNPGTVDVIPKGEIIYYKSSGNEISSSTINTAGISIAPNATHQFTQPAPTSFGIGKYKAYLTVNYGKNLTATLQDTSFFYILPLRQIIVIFLGFLFVVLLITYLLHRKFSYVPESNGIEQIDLYVREGRSPDVHHDIDLSKKNET